MKKSVIILLSILLAIILALGIIAYKNWNSIEAFVFALNNTQEDVENEMQRSKEALDKYINESENITVRELTEEESKALAEGGLTEEDAVKIITGTQEEDSGKEAKKPDKNESTSTTQKKDSDKLTEAEVDELIAQEIARLYVLKSQYMGKLDSFEAEAREVNKNLPHAEKKAHKQKVISENITRISKWETECDNAVYGIIEEIRVILKKYGRDQSILDEIKQAYLNEKRMKKSYYINRYMD